MVFSKLLPKPQENIKHDTDARECLAWKRVVREIGVHDGVCLWQRLPREVMICDENLETGRFSGIDTLMTRDAIIDGQQDVRLIGPRKLNDFRGQAITVLKSIGNEIIDRIQAKKPESLEG